MKSNIYVILNDEGEALIVNEENIEDYADIWLFFNSISIEE